MTPPSQHPTGPARPFYRQPWFAVVGGLAAIAVLGAVVGGGSADNAGDTSRPAVGTTTSSAPTTTEPAQISPTPVPAVAPTSSAQPPAPATTSTTVTVDFAMPDAVGMDLQSAQNLIQTFGVFYSVSHDLRGSRNQMLDSNWIICDQNIPPGQRVTGDVEGQIDLGVVKREESCP